MFAYYTCMSFVTGLLQLWTDHFELPCAHVQLRVLIWKKHGSYLLELGMKELQAKEGEGEGAAADEEATGFDILS